MTSSLPVTTGPEWGFTSQSRIIERGGISWHVQISGSGPTLLLVHGTGASSHSFRRIIPMLAKRFTVVAPDLPGHALSHSPSWFEPSLPIMAAALEELLLALELEPHFAVGHSAGAAIVVRMVLERAIDPALVIGLGAALTPLRGVVRALSVPAARLLAAASDVIDLRVKSRARVERMIRSLGSVLDAEGIDAYHRLSEDPVHVAGVLAMLANWDIDAVAAELPKLSVPVLLIAGASDRAVPLASQRNLMKRIPSVRLAVVRSAGHLLHEERPDDVASLILAEADRYPARTATTTRQGKR